MIDFNQDIAPLRQQYFPEDARAFERAMAFRQQQLMPMRQQTLKMLDNQQRRETAALNYQAAQLSLDEKKKEIEGRQMYRDLEPEIVTRVNSILEDPSKSTADKSDEMFALQREYNGPATNSPLIHNLLRVSDSHLRRKAAEDVAKAAAEKDSTSSMRNSTANTYYSLATHVGEFNPEIYTGIKDGSLPNEAAATIINTFAKAKKERTEGLAASADLKTWFTKASKDTEDVTFKNKTLGLGEAKKWLDEQPSGTMLEDAPAGPLVFAKPKDRKLLYDQLRRFKPDLGEDDNSISDMDLRNEVLDLLSTFGKRYGFIPEVSISPPDSEATSAIKGLTGT